MFETIRAESTSAEVMDHHQGRHQRPTAGVVQFISIRFFTADFGDDGSVVADNGSGDGTKSVIIIISRWKIARTNSAWRLWPFLPFTQEAKSCRGRQ